MALKKVTTMNVSLPAELARFVRAKVESGHYSSVSEVIREALRLLASQSNGLREVPPGEPARTLSGAPYDRRDAEEAVAAIREISGRCSLDGLSIDDLINEGREL